MTRRPRLSLGPERELRNAPPQGHAPDRRERPEASSARQRKPERTASKPQPPARKAAAKAPASGGLPPWLNARSIGKALLVVGVAAASILLLKRRL